MDDGLGDEINLNQPELVTHLMDGVGGVVVGS